jgi:hypothetical protein
MTETEPPFDESKPASQDVQTDLYQYVGQLGKLDETLLTPRQLGLIEECRGLLMAVASGRDFREGPRIRECLVETLSLFAPPQTTCKDIPAPEREAIGTLRTILRLTTARGIALEAAPDRAKYRIDRSPS